MKKRVLISVSDKTNIVDFAKVLVEHGYEIISTGGTSSYLSSNGIDVINIEDVTSFPEILDGRVKTLHPKIHGGLLSLRNNDIHKKHIIDNDIELIDMVVVNLYPFKEVIKDEDVEFDVAIENIDIGGPSMLRSAAKNYKYVTTVCDVKDYSLIEAELQKYSTVTDNTKLKLSAKAFRHTASYDAVISNYLTNDNDAESITFTYDLHSSLRYGENPHQNANFYIGNFQPFSIGHAKQHQGKQLSYNNIQDGNAALNIVKEFDMNVVAAVKHMSPCGVGVGESLACAFEKAYNSDPVSIFGGIVATNCEIDETTAKRMNEIFLEVIIAPSFTKEALEVFSAKKNLRVLEVDMGKQVPSKSLVSVCGGLLVQDEDSSKFEEYKCVTNNAPSAADIADMIFAWRVCKHVKSNAIVVVKDGQTIGIGTGQTSRVGAAFLALESARDMGYDENIIMASDAFFPFDDVIELAHGFGVKTIVQPGGSINDAKVIDKCNEYGITMVFSDVRNFKH